MHVDPRDKRWSKLVRWLANEHKILAETLGRKPTTAEHRAYAHAFIDMVFDDQEQILAEAAARAVAAAAAKVVPFAAPSAQR
jgi:antirestriction protein ArdC